MSKVIKGIDDIMGGATGERFELAMREIMENLYDINRPHKTKRKVVMEFSFTPNENRDAAEMEFNIHTKLAPLKTMSQPLFIEKDASGNVTAYEQTREIPGQVAIDGTETTQKIIRFAKGE